MELIEPERKERNDLYGKRMEDIACDYLKLEGYKILKRNYLTKVGEIDIIAFEKKTKRFVFVEVKARKSINYGFGREAVNAQKIFTIRNVASLYLKSIHKLNAPTRFDVIEIMNNQIMHLKAVC